MLELRPDLVIIIAGVNDIYQGRPAESVIANLRGLYDQAARTRLPVVAGSIVPYNTATSAQNAAMRDVNAWIAAEAAARPELTFADTRAAAADPSDPDRLRLPAWPAR